MSSDGWRKRLASEPRLAEVARGDLRASRPIASTAGTYPELAKFAREVRALLGFEQLPEPASAWTEKLATGELLLRRTLAVGKLELRLWEGELTLFRRPAGDLKRVLDRILERPLGEEIARSVEDDGEVVEWACSGALERLLAVRRARSVLLRFVPRREAQGAERIHERADDVAIERVSLLARPPSPWASPAPLKMPGGGRSPARTPLRKKRVRR